MIHGWARRAGVALVLLGGLATAGAAGGAEFHYALIFGAQPSPKQARLSHTWAVFVRAVGEGPDPSAYAVEARVISWAPATLDVRIFAPDPEPGVNLSLPETLDHYLGLGGRVTLWGPLLVEPEIYERADLMTRKLASGAVRYKAIDPLRDPFISDCIHAVSDLDITYGRGRYPLFRVGHSASRYIARQIATRECIEGETGDHAWLIPRLGLDRYPIDVVPARRVLERRCPLRRMLTDR